MKKIYALAITAFALTTGNAQLTVPYTQSFDTVPPANWTKGSGGDITTGPINTYSSWTGKAFLADTTTNDMSLAIEMFTTNRKDWLISDEFQLAEESNILSFDYGATSYYPSGGAPNTTALDDVFAILISTDGGTTWESLQSWTAPNTIFTNSRGSYSFDLSEYAGSNVKFAFYADEGTVYNWQVDYYIFVDNFKIENDYLSTSASVLKPARLYPNPTSGKVYTESNKTIKKAEIYNNAGQLVSNGNTIDLTGKPAGNYTVKVVYTDGTSSVEKIIKK